MLYHHTKNKGDLGVVKVIADLVERGYGVLLPISEHLPYDIVVADERGELIKIQAKYRDGDSVKVSSRTSWADKNGSHASFYSVKDFDYFAAYSPSIDKVFYIPWNGSFVNINVRTVIPNSANHYYWYEDFLELKPSLPEKRKNNRLPYIRNRIFKNAKTKISWPPTEEVIKMVKSSSFLQVGKNLGVSDNAVRKFLKRNGVDFKKEL